MKKYMLLIFPALWLLVTPTSQAGPVSVGGVLNVTPAARAPGPVSADALNCTGRIARLVAAIESNMDKVISVRRQIQDIQERIAQLKERLAELKQRKNQSLSDPGSAEWTEEQNEQYNASVLALEDELNYMFGRLMNQENDLVMILNKINALYNQISMLARSCAAKGVDLQEEPGVSRPAISPDPIISVPTTRAPLTPIRPQRKSLSGGGITGTVPRGSSLPDD